MDVSLIHHEWKICQSDVEVPRHGIKQSIDLFWNSVFELQSSTGEKRYPNLQRVVWTDLVLAQVNSESERSLSVNGRLLTKDRVLLGEKTITGLLTVKEVIDVCDPVRSIPELIPVTQALKTLVHTAHAAYPMCLSGGMEEENQRKEESRRAE